MLKKDRQREVIDAESCFLRSAPEYPTDAVLHPQKRSIDGWLQVGKQLTRPSGIFEWLSGWSR